ncbi:hypothetical protein [Clostridium estertheticum]|nr:hypothetical protein [Clostridium estertheticum]MCB2339591.1 hypothetical protein [Clostridium estertheticum]
MAYLMLVILIIIGLVLKKSKIVTIFIGIFMIIVMGLSKFNADFDTYKL